MIWQVIYLILTFWTVLTKTASNVSGIIPNLRISFHIYTPRISDVKLAQISFNFRNMQEKALSGVMVMYITVSRKKNPPIAQVLDHYEHDTSIC